MKKVTLTLLTVLFLCFSCNDKDTSIEEEENQQNEQTGEASLIKDIDISSMNLDFPSEITDFDIEDGYLYYNYKAYIYRLDLSLETPTPELVIEDEEKFGPSTLTVINNTLYYQNYWVNSSNIKKKDLNNTSTAPEEIGSTEVFRGKLIKNVDKLIYLSATSVFSATTNFYQLNESATDEKIIVDQASFPYYNNLKFLGNYIYFTSENEVRRIDLNNPTQESSIVFTTPGLENDVNGEIIGFDVQDNMIYFSKNSTNQLFSANLNMPNEAPEVISTNTNLLTSEAGYTELIINDGYLYAKKTAEDTIAVIKI